MNSIIGMADLLGIDENLDEVQSQKIDILKKAGFTLLHLINQILDLTKLDAREVLLEETEVHLLNLVKEVTSFAHQGDARDREPAIIEIKPILPEIITIDAAQLKKILLALLSNAFKFSNHGKVYLTLDLGSWQPRHTLILTIKDHGIGINKSDLEAIFKPFIQADGSDTRRYSGTGLGLAITQHVCHLMDGEITVESELGKGTTFTVQLPFK
jgi:signal transduction histidine kinase